MKKNNKRESIIIAVILLVILAVAFYLDAKLPSYHIAIYVHKKHSRPSAPRAHRRAGRCSHRASGPAPDGRLPGTRNAGPCRNRACVLPVERAGSAHERFEPSQELPGSGRRELVLNLNRYFHCYHPAAGELDLWQSLQGNP